MQRFNKGFRNAFGISSLIVENLEINVNGKKQSLMSLV